jgi:hypothetical protein
MQPGDGLLVHGTSPRARPRPPLLQRLPPRPPRGPPIPRHRFRRLDTHTRLRGRDAGVRPRPPARREERVMNPTDTRPPGPEHRGLRRAAGPPGSCPAAGASSPTLSWCWPRRGASTAARSCSPASVTTANTAAVTE